jgi:hypothetical protein
MKVFSLNQLIYVGPYISFEKLGEIHSILCETIPTCNIFAIPFFS